MCQLRKLHLVLPKEIEWGPSCASKVPCAELQDLTTDSKEQKQTKNTFKTPTYRGTEYMWARGSKGYKLGYSVARGQFSEKACA